MKKLILFFLLLATMPALAQSELKFGYLSYNAVMQAMPEYAAMQNSMAELRQKYEAEQKRVEDDFNKKYEEFLRSTKSSWTARRATRRRFCRSDRASFRRCSTRTSPSRRRASVC